MNTRYTRFFIAGGVVLVLAIGAVWFWSLGAVASEELPTIRLDADRATVEIKRVNETAWVPVTTSLTVQAGDEIRTDAEGQASIYWADQGITRLDTNTDLIIEHAPTSSSAITNSSIQLHIVSGRAWSRLLKLIDVDSQAVMRTDTVVATVRGTAFGLTRVGDGTEIAVTESVVDVRDTQSSTSTLIREGRWGKFNAIGAPEIVRDLQTSDAWPQENKQRDVQFDNETAKIAEEYFRRRTKTGPRIIRNLSEKTHIALTSNEQKDDLRAAYMGRRVAERVLGRNPSGEGLRNTRELDRLTSRGRERVLRDLQTAVRMRSQQPGSQDQIDPELTQDIQRARQQLLGKTSSGSLYAELLNQDDQIDAFLSQPNRTEAERMAILKNVEQFEERLPGQNLPVNNLDSLRLKALALRERLQMTAGTTLVPTLMLPPPPLPGLGQTSPTDSGAVAPPVVQNSLLTNQIIKLPPPPPTSPLCGFTQLKLFASPLSPSIGQHVVLGLIGTCNNEVVNLNSRAAFKADPVGLGQFDGSQFIAQKNGSVTITATMVDQGIVKTAHTTITIGATLKKPLTVLVTTPGPTTLTTAQSAPLEAKVTYSDQTTFFVTNQCAWTSSNPTLASISNAKLFAGNGTGEVYVNCKYAENGVAVTGNLRFVINLDPALQPMTGGILPFKQ